MIDTNDLFLRATRQKFRFPSIKGELTVEQLWDLKLTSRDGFDLDNVAKSVNADLKAASEESFVAPLANPSRTGLAAKLDVVKAVIAVKIDEAAKAEKRAQNAAKRRQIEEALAASDARELSSASKDDLMRMLRELEAE